jgi:hypothetical protein
MGVGRHRSRKLAALRSAAAAGDVERRGAMASPAIAVPRSVAGGRCSVFMVTGCIGLTALAPERPTAIPADVHRTETSSDGLVPFPYAVRRGHRQGHRGRRRNGMAIEARGARVAQAPRQHALAELNAPARRPARMCGRSGRSAARRPQPASSCGSGELAGLSGRRCATPCFAPPQPETGCPIEERSLRRMRPHAQGTSCSGLRFSPASSWVWRGEGVRMPRRCAVYCAALQRALTDEAASATRLAHAS